MLLAMADRRASVGIMNYCLLVSTLTVMSSIGAQLPINNQLLGVQYVSYTNFEGTLATGDCCDESGKTAGACAPDLCDTAFLTCATSVSKCDLAPHQSTPVTFNTNNILFGPQIGNGVNKTTSFPVLKFPYIKHNITFSVQILETPEPGQTGQKQDIADLQFVVDWVDPIYLKPPHYRRLVLNDTRAQLVVDVVSQCSKHYFTEDCSVFCQPDKIHFSCLDNGTIQCLPGWSGSNCLTMIDYCPGNTCQHGSTCKPVLLNYTCDCTSDFEGHYCESAITTVAPGVPSIPTTSATTPATTTATTNAHTLTSTMTNSTNQGKSMQSSDSGDDSVAPVAAGVTVGLLALLTIVAAVVYYVIKKKNERSQVKPNKKRSLKEEKEKVSTPRSDRTISDVNGIEFNNEIKPKEEILRSLDSW